MVALPIREPGLYMIPSVSIQLLMAYRIGWASFCHFSYSSLFMMSVRHTSVISDRQDQCILGLSKRLFKMTPDMYQTISLPEKILKYIKIYYYSFSKACFVKNAFIYVVLMKHTI